jgi:hypothetical protein
MFVRLAALVLGAALAAALAFRLRRTALCVCGVAFAGFGAFQAGWVFHRYVVPSLTVESTVADRGWIDTAAPSASVALVPSPWVPASGWWEAEFWNKDVDRVLRVDHGPTYTPFPAGIVRIDFARGELRGRVPRNLLVLARSETRFGLSAVDRLAMTSALALVRVHGSPRLSWATKGAAADGWVPADQRATIRVFARGRSLHRVLRVTVTAPIPATASHRFTFDAGKSRQRAILGPGGRITERLVVCARAHRFADATVGAGFKTPIDDGRAVALHIDKIELLPAAASDACGSISSSGG